MDYTALCLRVGEDSPHSAVTAAALPRPRQDSRKALFILR
jgi:hypothetical protein